MSDLAKRLYSRKSKIAIFFVTSFTGHHDCAGQTVKSIDEFYKAIDKRQIGDTIKIEIWRDGNMKLLDVKLEAQSDAKMQDDGEQRKPTMKQQRKSDNY